MASFLNLLLAFQALRTWDDDHVVRSTASTKTNFRQPTYIHTEYCVDEKKTGFYFEQGYEQHKNAEYFRAIYSTPYVRSICMLCFCKLYCPTVGLSSRCPPLCSGHCNSTAQYLPAVASSQSVKEAANIGCFCLDRRVLIDKACYGSPPHERMP